MIILLLLMTICGLGHCLDQLPTQQEIQSSINRTISEVERLMKVNTSLPQLSRSQIVDILYNITSKEVESLEESVEKARSDYQRALMVVLPYNSRDAKNEDIKDLFTKPPMIQMIPDTETMLPFASIQAEQSPTEGLIDNLINVKYSSEINDELSSLEDDSDNYKIHLSDGEYDTKPEKFSFVLGKLEDLKSATDLPFQDHPINILNNQNNSTIEVKPTLDVFYSKVMTEKPTEKIMEITLNPIEDTKPTVPSTKSTNILTFDQWKYFAPPATLSTPTTKKPVIKTTTKQSTSTIKSAKPLGIVNKPQPFIPTVFSTNSDDTILLTPSPSIKPTKETPPEKPEFSSFDMADYGMMNDEPTGPIFVTPMPSEIYPEDSAALPSLTTLISVKPEYKQEINKSKESVNPKHKETLLESLGIDSKKNKLFIDSEKINLTNHNDLISLNSQVPENNNSPNSFSKLAATGFDNSQINLKEGLSNLTPDIRLLFQRFGLQTPDKNKSIESHESTTTKNPVQSIVKNSWSGFKPLPRSQIRDEGMRSFLAQFGLGIDNRREKSIRHDDSFKRQSIIDFVPVGMKSILENIGLIGKPRETTKKLNSRIDINNVNNNIPSSQSIINNNINSSDTNKSKNNYKRRSDNISNHSITLPPISNQVSTNHIFKPHETQISDQKQREKINELLDTVKLVQEGKAQVSDVRRVANDLLEAAKTLKGGPDLLSLEEIIKIYHDDLKNEVKRQNKADADEDKKNGSLASSVTTADVTTLETSMDDTFSSTNIPNTVNQTSNLKITDSDAVETHTDTDIKSIDTDTTTTESSLSTEDTNISDLADSFGGSTAEPDPALPAPRKSGLYFLLDWNSFLEVGEEGKDRVNLRLAPKVGDRSRFIPVVIP
ncbi:uncharacterized protein [Chelonus insularis]|uniref:uncharacterized protein n=1 Tax=Chelonus insularis TaxID=460826 RepID=UPI001588B818|nr:uncharacterized protein LOC118069108 [Chelonus insularis]